MEDPEIEIIKQQAEIIRLIHKGNVYTMGSGILAFLMSYFDFFQFAFFAFFVGQLLIQILLLISLWTLESKKIYMHWLSIHLACIMCIVTPITSVILMIRSAPN